MSVSAKQAAMAWINSKLANEFINPEREEMEALVGELSDKKFEEAVDFVRKDLIKLKPRYQAYVDKYVSGDSAETEIKEENNYET